MNKARVLLNDAARSGSYLYPIKVRMPHLNNGQPDGSRHTCYRATWEVEASRQVLS